MKEYILNFMIDNALIFLVSLIWILGGQLFSDMISYHRRIEELPLSDKIYYTCAWPFLVLKTIIKIG